MDLLIAFLIFIGAMVGSLTLGLPSALAIAVGLLAFTGVALHRGYRLAGLVPEALDAVKSARGVVFVMAIIGLLTGIWRLSGTITVFVYYGVSGLTPGLFLLLAFLLAALLSYTLGTSFGVTATLGVIFMAIARAGAVDPLIAGGVLMSGAFFGDRASPVSSSANLVAAVTGTEILRNVRLMMKTGAVPFLITVLVYGLLSVRNPLNHLDTGILAAIQAEYGLSLWCFLPAALMLVLPLLKIPVIRAMIVNIVASGAVAVFVQGEPLAEILKVMLLGYHRESAALGTILDGGGLLSMSNVIVVLILSAMYSGIFKKTGMLKGVQGKLSGLAARIGRFPATALVGLGVGMVFCNQTIAILMTRDFMESVYTEAGAEREELAIDMENSVVLLACLVPWGIGCSVPLQFLGVSAAALPYAVFMYAVPLTYLFLNKKKRPGGATAGE